jgi:hypothetical protein
LNVIKEFRLNIRLPSACSSPGNIDYKEYYYDSGTGGGSGRDYGDRFPSSWGGGTGGGPPGYRGPTSYISYLYDRNGSSSSSDGDLGTGSSSASGRISTVRADSGSTKPTPSTTS